MTRTHKASGWTRTAIGHSRYKITATDGSADRIVAFMSAHSWQNLPADDRANVDRDRVVLIEGPALPDFALTWLTAANARQCADGRAAFQRAIDDADNAPFRDGGW